MFLWALSAVLSILANKFGTLYLVLGILPIFAFSVLFTNERKNTYL